MVRQGPRHRRRGRAGERGGAQGATHHSPCTVSSSSLLPGGEAAVSCETTLSEFSRERMAEGQPLMPLCGHLSLITCSSFSVGDTDSATLHGSSAETLGARDSLVKFTSFLFMIQECGSIFI